MAVLIHVHKVKDADRDTELSAVKDLKSSIMQAERKAESVGQLVTDSKLKKACQQAEAKLEEARRIIYQAL